MKYPQRYTICSRRRRPDLAQPDGGEIATIGPKIRA